MIPLHFLNEEENEKDKNPIENNEEKDVLPIKSLAKSIEEMQISWKTESKLVNVQIESEITSSELSDSSTQSNEETTKHNIDNIITMNLI